MAIARRTAGASGEPGAGLLQRPKSMGAELIAVGFRGTGLFERFLLGSVSRAIVHSAQVPVLVVKTTGGRESEKVAGTPDGTFRALAAYDGSEFGERIASVAGKLSWPDSTRGWALTVVPPMFHHQLPDWMQPIQRNPDVQAMAEAWQKEFDQQLEQSVDELKNSSRRCPRAFHATEPIVAQGHPAEQVLATLTRQKIDLAIVGSRGHGAWNGCWWAAHRPGSSTKPTARCWWPGSWRPQPPGERTILLSELAGGSPRRFFRGTSPPANQ